jgi:hypothetical protein
MTKSGLPGMGRFTLPEKPVWEGDCDRLAPGEACRVEGEP